MLSIYRAGKIDLFENLNIVHIRSLVAVRPAHPRRPAVLQQAHSEKEFFIDNLLVRIYFIIVMIRWTGLAPWKFDSLFQVALHLHF